MEFGLSQPTFTRFAGGEWEPGDEPLPDLWKNVSMSLGMDAAMMEVAEGAGVRRQVEQVLRVVTERRGRRVR